MKLRGYWDEWYLVPVLILSRDRATRCLWSFAQAVFSAQTLNRGEMASSFQLQPLPLDQTISPILASFAFPLELSVQFAIVYLCDLIGICPLNSKLHEWGIPLTPTTHSCFLSTVAQCEVCTWYILGVQKIFVEWVKAWGHCFCFMETSSPAGCAAQSPPAKKRRVVEGGLLRPRQSRHEGPRPQTNGSGCFGERHQRALCLSGREYWDGSRRTDNCLKDTGSEGMVLWEGEMGEGKFLFWFCIIYKCAFRTTDTEKLCRGESPWRSIFSVRRVISTHLQRIECQLLLILVLNVYCLETGHTWTDFAHSSELQWLMPNLVMNNVSVRARTWVLGGVSLSWAARRHTAPLGCGLTCLPVYPSRSSTLSPPSATCRNKWKVAFDVGDNIVTFCREDGN